MCNPAAKAKHHKNGKCSCPPPYTGDLCHQCEKGFMADKIDDETYCIPEEYSDAMECNGFGAYNKHKETCEC